MPPAGARPPVDVALAVVERGGRLLVARRGAGNHLAGSWEFPGGKVGEGEEPEEAARRELLEEAGLRATRVEPLLVLVHEYPERAVRLHVFLVRGAEGEVVIDGGREHAWLPMPELDRIEMPAANAPILRALRWRLR